MVHKHRRWVVFPCPDLRELAVKLTDHTWCCCNGFSVGPYVLLNDSFGPDGAQEYGVLKKDEDRYLQLESLTFGWMSTEKAVKTLQKMMRGEYDVIHGSIYGTVDASRVETPEQHGKCRHCQ